MTGLSNDKKKYYIHHNYNNELLTRHIADLFTVKEASIDDRMNYLGYFLKPNIYLKSDWNWLVNKLQRKIEGWTSHWISLGSRLTLSTVVLQSVPVYWFLMMHISVRIFTKIGMPLFNYPWHGKAPTIKFHLTSWESLSKPRFLGGWGIKNLALFNSSLCSKSLWWPLHNEGIWGKVIGCKYLRRLPYDL